MRLAHTFVLVLALAGCTRDNGLYNGGDGGSGGDGGGDDAAMCGACDGGADLRPVHDLSHSPDLASLQCGASGGCPTGPLCGVVCCGTGQRCDGNTCKCGMNAACLPGEICASGGPSMPGQCGTICCGGAGNPCPL